MPVAQIITYCEIENMSLVKLHRYVRRNIPQSIKEYGGDVDFKQNLKKLKKIIPLEILN